MMCITLVLHEMQFHKYCTSTMYNRFAKLLSVRVIITLVLQESHYKKDFISTVQVLCTSTVQIFLQTDLQISIG